jgi:serine/threonine protein kinase
MTPERWARVKEVFHAALAQEASQRAAFLAEATIGDEDVRSEVERLLNADIHSGDFIETPATATLLNGRVISHYEIGHLLGSGGMGRVYAARDTELGREVALKVASLDSPDAQARLRREAQHASRLSHPNICHIYEVGRADGQPFVVMERVEGRSLAEIIGEGPLPLAGAQRYGLEIADALAHAHERGVTHRDLKSTNVMVTARGVKVLDFGLARMLDTHEIDALSQSQRSLTGAGLIAGTLPYMAPELLRGHRGDQRADIWALGVLLYEMVSGRRPFTGGTGFELSAAILAQAPEALPATVPAPMAAIIHRCLAKNPGERYQQAADVHLALQEMKSDARTSRLPTGMPRRLAVGALLLAIVLVASAIMSDRVATENETAVEAENEAESSASSNARGYALLQTGEFEPALKEFQGVANREPNDANAWDSLGEGYLANGMPEKSFEAYSKALFINPTFESSLVGRGLVLAALGRYDEALERRVPDFRVHAFLLSRIGRYHEAEELLSDARRDLAQGRDIESAASALLTSAWLLFERRQYAPALAELRAVETMVGATAPEPNGTLMVLVDLIAGQTEIAAGNVQNAVTRLESQRSRYDRDEPVESNWVAALEGEIALAQGDYDRAISRFKAAERPAWPTLARPELALFAVSPTSRDGRARVEIARGNRAAAIQEYRLLTTAAAGRWSSAAVEPRYVLALARLLDGTGDQAGARVEYTRFLKLWASADQDLPELVEARRAAARLSGS